MRLTLKLQFIVKIHQFSLVINFHSFTHFSYKIGLIKTLFYRASKVTHLLGKNEYPLCVTDKKKSFCWIKKMKSIDISVIISNQGASYNYII